MDNESTGEDRRDPSERGPVTPGKQKTLFETPSEVEKYRDDPVDGAEEVREDAPEGGQAAESP
jgi:hypothetical protein